MFSLTCVFSICFVSHRLEFWLKFPTDAAGLGVAIRDSSGEVIGDMSQRVPLPQTVVKVEALACRRAVSFAIELGLRELVIEGDYALVI